MSKLIIEIVKINSLKKHPNADKLEIATIKGWECIVQKGKFTVNSLCIFVPPDSIIPINLIEKYKLEFLKKDGRVKTVKLRGVISEGLILDIPEGCKKREGLNVANLMGITHWEQPEPKQSQHKKETYTDILLDVINRKISIKRFIFKTLGLIKDYFSPKKKTNPHFDKYTDIENIKNFPDVLLEGEEVVITEKAHGSNIRFGNLKKKCSNIIDKIIQKRTGQFEFVYGSHNIQKRFTNLHNGYYKEDIWGKIVKKYDLEPLLPNHLIFYGEVIGKGVQDLTYGFEDIQLFIFDIKDTKTKTYYNHSQVIKICNALKLPIVPLLYEGKYSKEIVNKYTEGNSVLCPSQIKEGCVIKPIQERYDHKLGRVILKSISTNYLLRKNGTEFK